MPTSWVVASISCMIFLDLAFTKGVHNDSAVACNSATASACDQHLKDESVPANPAQYQNCSVLIQQLHCLEDQLSQCQSYHTYRTIISHKTSAARKRMESMCPAFETLSDSPDEGGSSVKDSSKSCQRSEVDECLQSVYPFMKNESLSGLSADKEERNLACSVFTKGMKCIDEYTASCLEPKQRKALQKNLWGARQVMIVVCNNENVKEGYGHHNECFKELSSKISNCLDALQKSRLKRPYYSKEDAIRETCCGQKNFLHCVSYEAQRICDQGAIDFAIRIFKKMYTPQVNKRCRSVTLHDCSGSQAPSANITRILVVVFLAFGVWSSL